MFIPSRKILVNDKKNSSTASISVSTNLFNFLFDLRDTDTSFCQTKKGDCVGVKAHNTYCGIPQLCQKKGGGPPVCDKNRGETG